MCVVIVRYTFQILIGLQSPDWDMIFADDERKSNPTGFAFLQAAHLWKQRQQQAQAQGGGAVANLLAAAPTDAVIEDLVYSAREKTDETSHPLGKGDAQSEENLSDDSDE
jgi:hypothetical protein